MKELIKTLCDPDPKSLGLVRFIYLAGAINSFILSDIAVVAVLIMPPAWRVDLAIAIAPVMTFATLVMTGIVINKNIEKGQEVSLQSAPTTPAP